MSNTKTHFEWIKWEVKVITDSSGFFINFWVGVGFDPRLTTMLVHTNVSACDKNSLNISAPSESWKWSLGFA